MNPTNKNILTIQTVQIAPFRTLMTALKDILLETLQYRIDNDERLILSEGIKDDIQELLRKVEDEYL